MWISKMTSELGGEPFNCCTVGVVSIGGNKPSVITEGEIREAERLDSGGSYVPEVGDTVILVKTTDDDIIVLGKIAEEKPDNASDGDVYVKHEKGSTEVIVKKDSKIIINSAAMEIKGDIKIIGAVDVKGSLTLNGKAVKTA